ncbi:MAG TPA: CDP-alcohol phosphatidyltransferase family protein [Candidatus Binataceae bacterium]|jgi:phosphatidylcholine synthase|nr:CDP-alcohol phosphatidyltransferase family protein [Candidatus Binataceae bacterium]
MPVIQSRLRSREAVLTILAWAVHAYTASGALIGLLAIKLAAEHRFRGSFIMMAVATAVDSSDGVLARALEVKTRIPNFDGALLDNIVDYLTYVVAPAYLMLCAGVLPAGIWGYTVAAAILLSSAYGFCQTNAKTPDHYFLGFPSYWNLVAFYLYCFGLRPALNAAILVGFAALVFVPIKYIYPSRTELLRRLTVTLGVIWAVLIAYLLATLRTPNHFVVWLSFSFIGYYLIMSLVLHAWTTWALHRTRTHERQA